MEHFEHFLILVHCLALLAGAFSLGQAVILYRCYEKPVIRYYGYFLLALFLFLVSFSLERYTETAGIPDTIALAYVVWFFQAAGGIVYVAFSPFFYHTLLGLRLTRAKKVVFWAVGALVAAGAFAFIAAPGLEIIGFFLNAALLGMIGYGLVLVLWSLRSIPDLTLRKALIVFLVISACFFPFLYLEFLVGATVSFKPLSFLNGWSLPVYFFILNVLSIFFAYRYLNRPPYRKHGSFTDHFRSAFGVTPGEEEIIVMLLKGESSRSIGDQLSLPVKAVENHLYNIYHKLGVRNQVQLSHLIRANTLD